MGKPAHLSRLIFNPFSTEDKRTFPRLKLRNHQDACVTRGWSFSFSLKIENLLIFLQISNSEKKYVSKKTWLIWANYEVLGNKKHPDRYRRSRWFNPARQNVHKMFQYHLKKPAHPSNIPAHFAKNDIFRTFLTGMTPLFIFPLRTAIDNSTDALESSIIGGISRFVWGFSFCGELSSDRRYIRDDFTK